MIAVMTRGTAELMKLVPIASRLSAANRKAALASKKFKPKAGNTQMAKTKAKMKSGEVFWMPVNIETGLPISPTKETKRDNVKQLVEELRVAAFAEGHASAALIRADRKRRRLLDARNKAGHESDNAHVRLIAALL